MGDACYEYVMTSFENKQRDATPFKMSFNYPRRTQSSSPPMNTADWLLGSRGVGMGILRALARIQKQGFVIDLSLEKRKNKR